MASSILFVIIKWEETDGRNRGTGSRRSKEVSISFLVGKCYYLFHIFCFPKREEVREEKSNARHVPETCPPSGRQREAAFPFRPVVA